MRHPSRAAGTLLIAATLSGACRRAEPPAHPWRLHVEAVPSPAGPASAQPQLTATAHGVLLTWLENADTTTTFKFAERTAAGWSAARTIASGRDFFVNFADVPSAIRLSDDSLVAHWL